MDLTKSEPLRMADMIMCGDHPSVTKTELNAKESKPDDKDKEKALSYARISPTTSRTDKGVERRCRGASSTSEHALRRRLRPPPLDADSRDRDHALGNTALLQAALGSFRWPPYLVGVWVVVLVLTHALHCIVTLLERALPPLKKMCQYFRVWTEISWQTELESNGRLRPTALACVTGLLYTLYFTVYLVYSLAVWAIEPLCPDLEDKQSSVNFGQAKITNYIEEENSKTSAVVKQ